MSCLSLIKAWILISVAASVAGWVLSAAGALNVIGYLLFGGLLAIGLWLGRARLGWQASSRPVRWKKIQWRFRHVLPGSFFVLAILIFAGGCFYAPNNHTALTYRTPRVLHWLVEGQWHWIHTSDQRLNDRACGIEWLSAPLLLFTKSERGLFLLNFFPFLLLPGLIFSVWKQLGVRGSVAWRWMWLLPTAYGFLLQAGSTGNDTFPTVYALAAMDFAIRARASRRISDVWFSILAAALLTGAKASNLPLLLPWALVVFEPLKLLWIRPFLTAGTLIVAALISFLPTAILNIIHCGDWSGAVLEPFGLAVRSKVVGIWGNAFLLVLKNFVPPLFPPAAWWNHSGMDVLPHALTTPMTANFEPGFHVVGEVPTEEWAGLGFGVSVLALVSLLASLFGRAQKATAAPRLLVPTGLRWCVLISGWVALAAYCMKCGMVDAARLVLPYYPFMLPLLLAGSRQSEIVRRPWWRLLAWGAVFLSFVVLVVVPTRPLWPARTVLSRALAKHPETHSLARALSVYTVFGERSDQLADVRELVPKGVATVGFLGTPDDIDISLWRPFFTRRVRHILLSDSPEEIRKDGLEYVVVGGFNLACKGITLADWMQQVRAELVAETTATQKVAEGPQPWYVVRLK